MVTGKQGRARKRMLWCDIRRTVRKSRGRFVSIVLLMALGAFALVGLTVAGPDMRATGKHYFDRYNAADLTVIGSLGIDASDEQAIEQVSGIAEVEYGYMKDMTITGTHDAVRVSSLPEDISTYEVVEGRLPQAADEVAVSQTVAQDHPVGSTIEFTEEPDVSGSDALARHEFTVVGEVNSAELISNLNMGQSQAGTGDLAGFAVVDESAFDSDVHMVARLRFDDTEGLDPYSQDYLDKVAAHKRELEDALEGRGEHRLTAVRAQFDDQIAEGQSELDDARKQLDNTAAQLDEAAAKISDARSEIASYEGELADAAAELASGHSKLDATWAQLQDAAGELDRGKSTLDTTQAQLAQAASALEAGRSELEERQAAYDEGVAAADAAQREIDARTEEFRAALAEQGLNLDALDELAAQAEQALAQADAVVEQAQAQVEGIQDAIDALDQNDPASAEDLATLRVQLAAVQEALKQAQALREGVEEQVAPITQAVATRDELAAMQDELDTKRDELAAASDQLAAARDELARKQQEYDAGFAAYEQGVASYNQALVTYRSGLAAWQAGAEELAAKTGDYEAARAQIDAAKQELAANEAAYEDGLAAYNDALPDAERKIANAEADLADARETRDTIDTPTYTVYNRREIPGAEGYTVYDTISEIVDSLALIFPYFLYFVAALVTFTTMARMVDEERINAGTLKALGYGDTDVIKKFAFYGAVAGLTGTVIGVIAGHTLLPLIVWAAYAHAFTLPMIELHVHAGVTVLAVVFCLIAAVLPAVAVAKRQLREKPAALLLPKPPAAGSKIMLEHVGPLWRRLSFTQKVTARNLFRYKSRALMTIVGVAGAAALLFTGFSVQHSVSGIGDRQFGELVDYDLIVAENGHVKDDEQAAINELLASDEVLSHAPIRYESVTKEAGEKGDTQPITLLVAQDGTDFVDYLTLQNRITGEALDLPANGAVISERLADLTGTQVGDTFTFTDADGIEREVRISGICEMYVTHFMFMSQSAYEKVMGQPYGSNAQVVKLVDASLASTQDMAARFMELDGVMGTVQNTMYINQVNTIVHSLNMIMVILIAVAGMLGIVIVYNLVTINVSERIRELSTIKVLGFYEHEVTMYIYRETIILSAIGVPVGWGIGHALQLYIIHAVPPEELMFNPACGVLALVMPVVVIAAVVAVMYVVVNHRLRHVDMLEALKSVD